MTINLSFTHISQMSPERFKRYMDYLKWKHKQIQASPEVLHNYREL